MTPCVPFQLFGFSSKNTPVRNSFFERGIFSGKALDYTLAKNLIFGNGHFFRMKRCISKKTKTTSVFSYFPGCSQTARFQNPDGRCLMVFDPGQSPLKLAKSSLKVLRPCEGGADVPAREQLEVASDSYDFRKRPTEARFWQHAKHLLLWTRRGRAASASPMPSATAQL